MIRYLAIRNLAVIESVAVDFEQSFNILTGETGAGKSILVEAVGLLLGGRATQDLIRTGEDVATVEAIFETEDGSELIVRREITSQGRSRAFINGALATAAALKDLSNRLVELHGQHEHQQLLDPSQHLTLLDAWANLAGARDEVAAAFATVRSLREQLDRLRMDDRERAARLDLVEFQLGELQKANLQPGEDETLAAERQLLRSADTIQRLCGESYAELYDTEDAALVVLGRIWKRVGELAAIDPRFAPYLDARDGIKAQLEDLAFTLRDFTDSIDASPARLQQVEDRLALIERLKRKHGGTLEEAIAYRDRLAAEHKALTGGQSTVAEIEQQLGDAGRTFLAAAKRLSASRRTAAPKFAKDVEAELADLAMERTKFEVRLTTSESEGQWTADGIDSGELFLSPNVGEDLRPLAKIVSGGELSRVMLALKTLAAADAGAAKTLIFDEVDAGIGGRVATVVGQKLASLGDRFQVLCITHLPQIAACGHSHFLIEKRVQGRRTVTSVNRLTNEDRVEEIARMMGGAAAGEKALASARELLDNTGGERRKRKAKAKVLKYFLETYGCQMNVHDAERMAGLLEQSGYDRADSERDADLVVINTCSVRERAEEKLYTRLGEIKEMARDLGRDPVVAVTGCVAQQEGQKLIGRSAGLVDIVVGTQQVKRLPMLADEALSERSAGFDGRWRVERVAIDNPYEDPSFPLGVVRRGDPVRAYITIIEGCNDFCSFCVVPYTRGHERMRSKAEILNEARDAAAEGRREIQLLGQIVNHYQAPDDPSCDFPALLEAVHEISGVDRIRFASPHPRHTSDRLIQAVRDLPKVCKHLHLPVQSGSSRVLGLMRRRHTRDEYLDLVARIRAAIPNVQLSTDMIVGFPGETEADFEETLSLAETVRYHSIYSFKYSERPNTLASKRMPDDVSGADKKRRIVALQDLQRSIQSDLFQRSIGSTHTVLVDATSRRREWELTGRTSGNTVVNFPGPPDWLGRLVDVTIKRAGPNSVWGEAAGAAQS